MISIEPEVERTAVGQARADGLPLTKYVASVVREAISKRQKVRQLAEKPFDEILKSFRDGEKGVVQRN